jgi:5-methyltetrahydrofolate--homocysteine methyltransferase
MGPLLRQLAKKRLLVSDGAWGTMLHERGLQSGDCPEEWNASHPDAVRGVAQAYAKAGADIVLTNTFGGSSLKLAKFALDARVTELNEAGAKLSLEGAPAAIVAASIGPTGEFLQPLGDISELRMEEVFEEQIAAIFRSGVQVLCIETMSAVEEAACAIRAARRLRKDAEIICTMTFSPTTMGPRTMMGVSCQQAAEQLSAAGADILGANCGNGPERMVAVAKEFRKHTDKPILLHPNAGLPELEDGRTIFRQSPQDMAAFVPAMVEAGASILGGCCGTTPEHIAAIRAAVDACLARQ